MINGNDDSDYLEFLKVVCDEDIKFIKEREKLYKSSWKRSGGRSGWFMILRKIDRLQEMMKYRPPEGHFEGVAKLRLDAALNADDIFKKIEENPSGNDATVLSEIRDLRRYLCMVEAEMISKGVVKDIVENGYKYNKSGVLESLEIHPVDQR